MWPYILKYSFTHIIWESDGPEEASLSSVGWPYAGPRAGPYSGLHFLAQRFCPCAAAHSQAQASGFFSINPTLRPASAHGVARAEKKITAGLTGRLAFSSRGALQGTSQFTSSLLTSVAKLDIFIKDDYVCLSSKGLGLRALIV